MPIERHTRILVTSPDGTPIRVTADRRRTSTGRGSSMATAADWQQLADTSAAHVTSYVIDRRGHGSSGDEAAYTIDHEHEARGLRRSGSLVRTRSSWVTPRRTRRCRAPPCTQDPRTLMIVRSCTPRSKSSVAAVWRASWSRPSRTPAALSSFFQWSQSVRGFSARPISSLKIHPSSTHS